MQEVALYFTYPQPAAYFAWHLLTTRPDAFPGLKVRWTPILYRRLMALGGADDKGSPPLVLRYMYSDAQRWADAHGIPFKAPHRALPADQTAHRVHLLAQDADANDPPGGKGWEAAWLEAMHMAVRRDGMDPTDPVSVFELATVTKIPGLDDISDPRLDARLEANTQAALLDYACDVPFLVWKGEAFRGVDGLEWLSARLRGERGQARL
ncbi:MAG: DsbA family protein [Candidatus Thermoplasmatota archaeon]